MYEGIKGAPNFEKRHLRASKRQKTSGYFCPILFFELFGPNILFGDFLKEGIRRNVGHIKNSN